MNPFELKLSGSNIAQEQNDGRNDQSRFRVELFGEVGHKVIENFDGIVQIFNFGTASLFRQLFEPGFKLCRAFL